MIETHISWHGSLSHQFWLFSIGHFFPFRQQVVGISIVSQKFPLARDERRRRRRQNEAAGLENCRGLGNPFPNGADCLEFIVRDLNVGHELPDHALFQLFCGDPLVLSADSFKKGARKWEWKVVESWVSAYLIERELAIDTCRERERGNFKVWLIHPMIFWRWSVRSTTKCFSRFLSPSFKKMRW